MPNTEPGASLCHYTDRSAAFEHILPAQELRFSPYDEMRDPLENKEFLLGGRYSYPDDMQETDPRHPERAREELTTQANRIRSTAKLLSLTADADDFERPISLFARGWSRARMWEQYGEDHQGVCLVFDKELLVKAVVRSLRDQGHLHPYYGRVDYRQEAVGSTSIDFTELVDRVDEEFAREFVERNHRELFFLKSSDWATEYEFRFVITAPDTRYVKVGIGDAITGVVVGERFARWQRPSVLSQCRELGVGLLQLEWSTGRPRLWPIQTS